MSEEVEESKPRKSLGEKLKTKKLGLPVWVWGVYLLELLCPPLLLPTIMGHLIFVMFKRLRRSLVSRHADEIGKLPPSLALALDGGAKLTRQQRDVLKDIAHPENIILENRALKKAEQAGLLLDLQMAITKYRMANPQTIFDQKQALDLADKCHLKDELMAVLAQPKQALVAEVENDGWTPERIRKQIDLLKKETRGTWFHVGLGDIYKNMAIALSNDERILSVLQGKMKVANSPNAAMQASLDEIADSTSFIANSAVIGTYGASLISLLKSDSSLVYILVTNKRMLFFVGSNFSEIAHGNLKLKSEKIDVGVPGEEILDAITFLNGQTNEIYTLKDVDQAFGRHFMQTVNQVKDNWGKRDEPSDMGEERSALSDPLVQIEKLSSLKDKGILSEEEFQAQKSKLLARV